MNNSDLPTVTVAICTQNRAEQLRRGLQALTQVIVPENLEWEVLVVDNGSSDHTQQVILSFADRLPIRLLVEERHGVSYARNRAVGEAAGEYICWTDDDTHPHSNWLKGYLDAFVRHPDGAIFAGRVLPVLEGETPAWFLDNRHLLTDLLARCDLGDEPKPLDTKAGEWPIGANFALRMKEQKCHSFHPELGVSPRFKRLGEETAVIRAICAEGGKAYYVPDTVVDHHIVEQRQSCDYILTYHRSAGETWAALAHYGLAQFMGKPFPASSGPTLMGAPLWLWRLTAQNWIAYQWARFSSCPQAWLPHLQRYGYYRGALDFQTAHRNDP
ncbi:glycosyltransferase [Aurantiacibacter suaedae]|uniref:glycosyltransferase n=1 Tax=Aurantiacibacter suaedae TaxID=2545755 RepID=UPI0010F93AE8|nr:glycosyltransferase [Aurantiacibacter suaedae]